MSAFVPVDQRERERIATSGENLCVEAGAGTGKTTVLVDRIVHQVAEAGVDVRQMAVITFTEKAAAELAGRVRRGLEVARDRAADDGKRARIDEALRHLNATHIETIHAFASSLLRERPVEADLDPGFEVMDVLPAQLEFDRHYREWLTREMAADDPPEALVEALNLELSLDRVREAAEALHANRHLLPLAPYACEAVDARPALEELRSIVDDLRRLQPDALSDQDGAFTDSVKLMRWFEEVSPRSDDLAFVRRALVTSPWLRKNAGNQANWRRRSSCQETKARLGRAAQVLSDAKDRLRQSAVADLVMWLAGFVADYERERRHAGKADFDDLLIWAGKLLRENDEVRRYFAGKYRHILVDEFQDTDPIQVELVVSLCADDLSKGWRQARLRPGSLFVVGDPKQSIYRFRGADIAMYDDVKRHLFGGDPVRIVQNFRSGRPIIDWANTIFGQLFDAVERVQPEYAALAHHPHYQDAGAVHLLCQTVVAPDGGRVKADDIRRHEAATLAAFIKQRVLSSAWMIRGAEGTPVAARYRDVVVMIPQRTGIDIYEDAFARADVPYRHEGGRTFFARQEVRELTAVLRAIDDPGDSVAAVAALRSSAFGCSDEDLLLFRARGRRFDFMRLPDDATGPVADAMRTLRDLARLRHQRPLSELVRTVLDSTRLVEFAMLQPQGDQVAANLLKVIDQARTYAATSGRGLRGFVRWLKDNVTHTTDESDAPVSEETDDVVRIMTIHASKGLEFPVVVFANMEQGRVDRTTAIADRAASCLHLKLGKVEDGFRTPGFDGAQTAEERHRRAEERRLLYVAATRARDHLVLSFATAAGDSPPPEPKSLNDCLRLAGAGEQQPVDLSALVIDQGDLPVWRRSLAAADDRDVGRSIERRGDWMLARKELLASAGAPLRVHTASSLKPEFESAARAEAVRRSGATDFGTAVHAAIERAGIDGSTDIDAVARAAATEYSQPGREQDIAAIARRALASDAVQRARRSSSVLLEAPFAVALVNGAGPGLAEGRIDLMFEEDGALVVVDFKTDSVTPAGVAARAAQYRNQALIYAWSASRASGLPVREVVFVFATPGVEWSMPVDAAFLEEAEELLRRPVGEEEPASAAR